MEKELMADALECFQDHLQSYYLGWMLDNVSKLSKEQMDIGQSFFAYAYKRAGEDITVPRNGGSYQECRRSYEET
jgi:hypothetical protein